MSISGRQRLQPGDIVLACSDGFWSGLRDEDITLLCAAAPGQLADVLGALARRAVEVNAPYSDNTTAAALRWLG
jgi:serine/threonine protein phosphatase PrpC